MHSSDFDSNIDEFTGRYLIVLCIKIIINKTKNEI